MRAHTLYEQIEADQPGTPCRVHTFPHREDLAALTEDIIKLKEQADIVVLSLHSGIHFVPARIADYQKDIAHHAIDTGADIILCHHAHILKGIEVYRNKAVMYGLGNFAIENPAAFMKGLFETESHKEIAALNPDWNKDEQFPLPPDTRNSFMVKCVISDKSIKRVSILPVYINKQSEPELPNTNNTQFHSVLEYVKTITRGQKFNTGFTLKNNEVIIVE